MGAKNLLFNLLLAVFSFFGTSCIKSNSYKLDFALNYANENANELKKVLDHYSKHKKDSLKLKAAIFLIENMAGKGCINYTQKDATGISNHNIFIANIGIDSVNYLKKKLEDSIKCGFISYGYPTFVEDIKVIKSNMLIENIDYAFKAWASPWSKNITFDEFKEFVLPYRIGDEPLQNWRKRFYENVSRITQKVEKTTNDRLSITSLINDRLKKKYKYLHKDISYFPGQFTINQLNATKGGRCADLNMLMGYWLRAAGIPVATEFTNYWANSNYGGHAWLSILDTTNKFVPFNAMYDNPAKDSLPFKGAHLAKAYRNLFLLEKTFLKKHNGNRFLTPEWFSIDITKEYLPVSDVKIKVTDHTVKLAGITLSVLNGVYWKPINTEIVIKKGYVTFKNIARDVLYAPIIFKDGQPKTISSPFFVNSKGGVQFFETNSKQHVNIDIDISRLNGKLYGKNIHAIFWDNEKQRWVSVGKIYKLRDNPLLIAKKKLRKYLKFNDLPSNGIYRVIDIKSQPNNGDYGRPFLYNYLTKQVKDY